MKLIDVRLTGTTDTAGAATINADRSVFAYLERVEWIDGSLDDGVDAVLSVQSTPSGVAETLLTLTDANNDAIYYPRTLMHGETGTALTGTAGGDRTRYLVNGVPRLAITSGGGAKTGGCILYLVED